MAQTGYTPISIYYSSTASNTPTAGNLVAGELAINTADGKLFYKDSAGVVQTLASKNANSGSFTNLSYTGTLTGGTGVVNLGSGQFYKDASGNVGIGTSSPAAGYRLVVNTTGATSQLGISADSGQSSVLSIGGNGTSLGSTSFDLIQSSGSSDAYIYNRSNANLIFGTNNAERMRIDSSGNVGIGTTTTTYRLNVAGRSTFIPSSENYAVYMAYNSSTSGVWMGSPSANTQAFYNNAGDERMRIDSSGNLSIGTTSNVLAARLNVSQSASTWVVGLQNTANNSVLAITNGSGTANYSAVGFFNNGTSFSLCGLISVSGTSTSYATSSDYRLKENVAPMTGALNRISALKPVTYNWKSSGENGQGFIAHELQEVCPEAVVGEKDAVDAEGKPVYQGIDTSFLVATLTAAIQEQQALIANLTTRLTVLENK
jgi:hypothetical protein